LLNFGKLDRSKHPIKQIGNVLLVTAPIVVINHEGVKLTMAAQLLDFPYIPIRRIQGRRDSAVSDAVRGHLLFDASIFAVSHNNLTDTVASEPMS